MEERRPAHFRLAELVAIVVLLSALPRAGAQRTVVEKNGVGGKIEKDYGSGDKITEVRTFGADGKLQQKASYEYLPGYYIAQKTDITYWPNGQTRRIAHNNYDASANFTGETVEFFDESGKQIGGHKLAHDPWTGIYRCSEWNTPSQTYQSVKCPAGEEEGGGAEPAKKLTYSEVERHLAAAHKIAMRNEKLATIETAVPTRPPVKTVPREAALILPADLRPGERVSGSITDDPELYAEAPGATVTRLAIPFDASGEASHLGGWMVELPGEKPQRASGPITFLVPESSTLELVVRQAGSPTRSLKYPLTLLRDQARIPSTGSNFYAPALCLTGQLCMVAGPFNGDSTRAFAAIEDQPATIVVETKNAAFISVPESAAPGARPLLLEIGQTIVALPIAIGSFFIKNNHRDLAAGQTLVTFPTLSGPEGISSWPPGNFPASNLAQARRFIPDLQDPDRAPETGGDHAHEPDHPSATVQTTKQEDDHDQEEGQILLIIRNTAPDQISLRAATNETLVFHLTEDSFQHGEFKYDLLVEAKKPGRIDVKGYVIPLLAPVMGQVFHDASPRR